MGIAATVVVHAEDDGSFWAEVEELPGCFASARDRTALAGAVEEAVELYVRDGDGSPGAIGAYLWTTV